MHFLLLGIDSFIACVAIGAIVDRGSRVKLAALFGVADLSAFAIGAGLGWQISAGLTGVLTTGILVSLGLYLIVVAAGTSRVAANWTVWVVPWALTLDNVAYGLVGDRSTGALFADGAQQAMSSALLAMAGLLVAVALPRVFPSLAGRATANRVAGGALLLAAGGMALMG
jgi:hypothetical protein